MGTKLGLADQRIMLVAELGGVCACRGEDCWHDGPCGVSDVRCLHLDHVNGDGFADRKRLRSVGVVQYYADHLPEAREVLQVLCVNCNWMKRIRNRETRGRIGRNSPLIELVSTEDSVRRSTEADIANAPRYLELVDKYHGLVTLIIHNTAYADLLDWLESLGLGSSQQHTVSYYLAKNWLSKNPSGGTEEELAKFVALRVIDVSSITDICRKRMQEETEKLGCPPSKRTL